MPECDKDTDDKPAVTAAMTVHAEGALAAVSFRNLMTTAAYAEYRGVSVERIVTMDRPDRHTRAVFEGCDIKQ